MTTRSQSIQRLIALAVVGCSVASCSSQGPTSASTDGGTAPAEQATWAGIISGADSMKIGLDTFYAQEVQMTCSGTSAAPSAILRTTEGWVAEVSSVEEGFGPADVMVFDPDGKSYTFVADGKSGPTWNNGVLQSLFGRNETVDGKEWRLYIQKGSCA
ncbi:hypothetical protein [Luteococcus sanguinis]|uniref:Lipoprotein n=1 Tax=Luteococcus sanguinis TaxID=174038 RepID=A0ABW1X3W6_9ACTN